MTRWQQWWMMAGFLSIISVVPAGQVAVEAFDGQLPQCFDIFRHVPTRVNLRAYEKELEDRSIFARSARPWVQYGRFVLFRDSGDKVLFGRDGWLFYKPDVRYLIDSPVIEQTTMDAILDFRDQLAERRIHLMMIPMPGKPSIHGNMLTQRIDGSRDVQSPTVFLLQKLRAEGIETMDLFRLFQDSSDGGSYLARDTHWSPKTAEYAATAVAARLQELGWVSQGSAQFNIRSVNVSRRSDIARMTRVPKIEAAFPAEQVTGHQVFDSLTGEKYRDDPASPILVLGDSFLRIYETDEPTSAGFIAHLARQLRQPVASLVNDGGASTLVRQELARRSQLLEGKKVVIWEFVERDIQFGTEGWKRVPLSSARAAMPAPSRNP